MVCFLCFLSFSSLESNAILILKSCLNVITIGLWNFSSVQLSSLIICFSSISFLFVFLLYRSDVVVCFSTSAMIKWMLISRCRILIILYWYIGLGFFEKLILLCDFLCYLSCCFSQVYLCPLVFAECLLPWDFLCYGLQPRCGFVG